MTAAAINRRGACPALSSPMQTGDGLLVRLNPVSQGLTPKQLIGLCESAARHGNGIVEITARGSFQIRGLTEASAANLGGDVNALDIEVRSGVPVETSPLAGLDASEIADPRPVADAIRAAIADAGLSSRLGPKVSVIVDSGGTIDLAAIPADIRLTAGRRRTGSLWRIAIAGTAATAEPMGASNQEGAVGFAIDLLSQIAHLGIEGRARHLLPTREPETLPPHREAATVIPLQDSRIALSIGLPFGSAQANDFAHLATEAQQAGVSEFRLAPARRLLAICPDTEAAKAAARIAVRLGFIMDATDPRLSISACAGAPACGSAHFATRDAAIEIAASASELIEPGTDIHLSGCTKGCAHPSPASITLFGSENGVGLVVDGTARDLPLAYSKPKALAESVAGLLRAARASRRDGETLGDSLSRLDTSDAAQAFERDGHG